MSQPGDSIPRDHPPGSLETDSDEWLAEIERRAREVISGEVTGEPWEEAMTRLLERFDTE